MIPESNGEARRASEEVDIFKMEQAGVQWRGSFSSLEAAKARINQLLVTDPGEYFTHIQSTGNKIFFKPNNHNGNNHNGHNATR
jgi:hypothetical protein